MSRSGYDRLRGAGQAAPYVPEGPRPRRSRALSRAPRRIVPRAARTYRACNRSPIRCRRAFRAIAASQELRERVMATVRSEADLLKAAGAGADRPSGFRPLAPAQSAAACHGARIAASGCCWRAASSTRVATPTTHVSTAQLASMPTAPEPSCARSVLTRTGRLSAYSRRPGRSTSYGPPSKRPPQRQRVR